MPLAAVGLLAGREVRIVAFAAHLRSGQLRDGSRGTAMALCAGLRRGALNLRPLGEKRRPGTVTVHQGAAVSHDRVTKRRVVCAHWTVRPSSAVSLAVGRERAATEDARELRVLQRCARAWAGPA